MELPCYKCHQTVDEGIAFCPHCSAPQIRVVIAEAPVPATSSVTDSTESQDALLRPASQTVPVLALPMQWSQALKPCALAALIASVLMWLGLNLFFALFGVGFLAVIFYRQGQPGFSVKVSTAARLGAFGGLLCFSLTALLGALAATAADSRTKFREQLIESAEKWVAARPADPQFQAALEQLKTPEGLVMALIVGTILLFLLSIVLGGLGGALGGAIFGRRDRS